MEVNKEEKVKEDEVEAAPWVVSNVVVYWRMYEVFALEFFLLPSKNPNKK